MNITGFKVLTFDCYGTLIDWESGIHTALGGLIARSGTALPRDAVLQRFAHHESAQQAETPTMIYSALLARVHRRLAAEWNIVTTPAEDAAFGAAVPDWPAFADSTAALRYLQPYHRLVILSNVDRASFQGSNARLGVVFDAVYTAQDIGSYKPDPANFRYMLDRLAALGHAPGDILHVAQSLFHDHAPAQEFGLACAWIDRREGRDGWGATMKPPDGAAYDVRFSSLAGLVQAHQAELKG